MLSRFTIVAQLWEATNAAARGLEGESPAHDLPVLRIGGAKAPDARAHLPFDQGRLFRFHPRRGVLHRRVHWQKRLEPAVGRGYGSREGILHWAWVGTPLHVLGRSPACASAEVLEDPRRHTVSLPRG